MQEVLERLRERVPLVLRTDLHDIIVLVVVRVPVFGNRNKIVIIIGGDLLCDFCERKGQDNLLVEFFIYVKHIGIRWQEFIVRILKDCVYGVFRRIKSLIAGPPDPVHP